MRFVQISDSHIRGKRRPLGHIDTAKCLDHAIEQINGLNNQPDFVLVAGDVANDAKRDDYLCAKEIFHNLKAPLALIPGNHDDREILLDVFSDSQFMPASGFCQFTVVSDKAAVIALDTLKPGADFGVLCEERLNWFEMELNRYRDRPLLIAMHHPPFKTGYHYMDEIRLLDGNEKFHALVTKAGHIDKILCGHVHRHLYQCYAGTLAIICPGVAHQVPAFNDGTPAFLIHELTDEACFRTEAVAVNPDQKTMFYTDLHDD